MSSLCRQPGFVTFMVVSCAAAVSAAAQSDDTTVDDTTVYVASNGIDASPCGSNANPCRSISFGIANAEPGATVLVAPGRYGDLNGDGQLSGPGEELGEIGFGCLCVVKMDKTVRILSTHGAAATIIDASVFAQPTIPVFISANNAQFGRREQGFLVKAPENYVGVYVFSTTGTKVAGNIATGGATGFFTDGGSGNVLQYNIAYGNIVGFEIGGTHQAARFNYSSGNVLGFAVYATSSRLQYNIATANGDGGFVIAGTSSNVTLSRNLTTGNLHGFRVDAGGTPVITGNNIYGNRQCGIFNRSDTTINATRNFWGAASGPGADPADDVCNNEINDTTVTTPFAKRPFPVPRISANGNP